MLGILKHRKTINVMLFTGLILIVIQFYPSIRMRHKKPNYFTNTLTKVDTLQQAKSRELDLENKYQVTAIILHWKRLLGVQRLIDNYLKNKLVKEIIVWNNNPEINLTHNQIVKNNDSSILIRIINSKENLKDQAKYRACSNAQTLVCCYIDDDWDMSRYMKSLIASFRSDPNVLHSATNVVTYYNNMLWTFTDKRINLHTGFSWIGSGSVFLREHAERHLQLLAIHLKDHKHLLAVSDVLFAIWLNDIPSQMVVNLYQLPPDPNRTAEAFSSTTGFDDLQQSSSILAIQTLEHSLRLNKPKTKVTFPRQQNRRFPYCVRSPSPNDDFIFYSNILPVDIEHIPFNIEQDADRATYRNQPGGPNYTHFDSHNTLDVSDGVENTCWRPLGAVRKGDFFAIDFLHIQDNITFSLVIGHNVKLQRSLNVRVSFDGVYWISHRSLREIYTKATGGFTPTLPKLIFDSRRFSRELQSFRYISFNATRAFAEPFQVCDVTIMHKMKTNVT